MRPGLVSAHCCYHLISMTGITATRKRGRPPTGWTQVGVKMLPNQAARLDAWIASQPDKPRRAEAIRRLVDVALGVAPGNVAGPSQTSPPTSPIPAPTPMPASAPPQMPIFRRGDHVRGRVYGTGRVLEQPRASKDAGQMPLNGIINSGFEVQVRWDDRQWGFKVVPEGELELVSRAPDA